MAFIKDVIIAFHTVVITVAVKHLLNGYTLNDCQYKPCSSSLGNTAWTTVISLEEDDTDCWCCTVTKRSISSSLFTVQTTIHVFISLLAILLKQRLVSLRNHLWVYYAIMVVGLINGFCITRLFANTTVLDDANMKEGIIWKVVSTPFRFTLRLISSILYTSLNKLLIQPMGFSHWLENEHSNMPHVCFLKTNDVRSLSSDYGLAVLAWVYMVLTMYNIYSIIRCMGRDKSRDKECCASTYNNNCEDKVRRHVKKTRSLDCVDSYSSDEDSFVLGWRL